MIARALALGLVTSSLMACGSSKGSSSGNSASGFTVGGLAKAWTSNCESGSEPVTGDDHYKVMLTLNADGSYMSQMSWYTGSCTGSNVHIYYTTYGSYSLTDIPNSTAKTLNFTIDFVNKGNPDMMVIGNATRTAFNTKCGGTSPYNSGANATDGSHQDTVNLNCMGEVYPNSVLRKTFKNIATYDGGNFYIGLAADQNIPGAFDSNDVAASATIYLH